MFKLKSNKVMDTTDEVIVYAEGDEEDLKDRSDLKDKAIDYVLVYSCDKKKDDDEKEDDNNQTNSNRALGPELTKSEARVRARKIFLSNLKSAGLIINKVSLVAIFGNFFFHKNLSKIYNNKKRLRINTIFLFSFIHRLVSYLKWPKRQSLNFRLK